MRCFAFLVVNLPRVHLLSPSTVLQSIVFRQHTDQPEDQIHLFVQAPVSSSSPKVHAWLTSTSSVAMTHLSKNISMTFVVLVSNRVPSLGLNIGVGQTDNKLWRRGWCVIHLSKAPLLPSGPMCNLVESCLFSLQSGPVFGSASQSWCWFAALPWQSGHVHCPISPLSPVISWWFA